MWWLVPLHIPSLSPVSVHTHPHPPTCTHTHIPTATHSPHPHTPHTYPLTHTHTHTFPPTRTPALCCTPRGRVPEPGSGNNPLAWQYDRFPFLPLIQPWGLDRKRHAGQEGGPHARETGKQLLREESSPACIPVLEKPSTSLIKWQEKSCSSRLRRKWCHQAPHGQSPSGELRIGSIQQGGVRETPALQPLLGSRPWPQSYLVTFFSAETQEFWDRDSGKSILSYVHGIVITSHSMEC